MQRDLQGWSSVKESVRGKASSSDDRMSTTDQTFQTWSGEGEGEGVEAQGGE